MDCTDVLGLSRLLVQTDISAANMTSLLINLWTLSNKHGHVSNKLKVTNIVNILISLSLQANTIKYMKSRPEQEHLKVLEKIM